MCMAHFIAACLLACILSSEVQVFIISAFQLHSEPCREKTPTRSDKNRDVQSQKMARDTASWSASLFPHDGAFILTSLFNIMRFF